MNKSQIKTFQETSVRAASLTKCSTNAQTAVSRGWSGSTKCPRKFRSTEYKHDAIRRNTHTSSRGCYIIFGLVCDSKYNKSVFVLTSLSSASPSRSVEERASTRGRSALAVEINAVIYYGKVETYAERACAQA